MTSGSPGTLGAEGLWNTESANLEERGFVGCGLKETERYRADGYYAILLVLRALVLTML